jgi:hypothetical protein
MVSFGEMYADEVLAMKHLVMRYVQSAKAMQQQLKTNGAGIPVQMPSAVGVMAFTPTPKYSLEHTVDGFPVLPRPMNTQGWTKAVWEKLHMEFLCCHYSEWPVNSQG